MNGTANAHGSRLTIGKVAKAAGLGVETIRFYEREGLLPQARRRSSGYRDYGDDTVARLDFIRRAKSLGFTLSEIRELLLLRRDPAATPSEFKQQVVLKLDQIDAKIHELQLIRTALSGLAEACRGRGPLSECPIVDALDRGAPASRSISKGCHS